MKCKDSQILEEAYHQILLEQHRLIERKCSMINQHYEV